MTFRIFIKLYYKLILFIIMIISACSLLYFFNPGTTLWAPKCSFYLLTGLECPTCGSQRAVHTIMNGEIIKGFAYNPFIIIAIPYAVALISISLVKTRTTRKIKKIILCRRAIYIYMAIYIAWWIIRNII